MPEVNEFQRLFALSLRQQQDYDTEVAAQIANYFGVEFTDKDFARLTPGLSDNAEDAHGSEFAGEEFLESWDVEAPHQVALASETAGHYLLDSFGQVVTDQPDEENHPLVFRHVFTLLDHNVSRQLGVRTLVEIIGAAHNVMHPSMMLKMLQMSGQGKGRIGTTVQYHGSGREVAPSGLSFSQVKGALLTGLHYWFNSQAKLTIADTGTLANPENLSGTRKFREWAFGINNNPDLEGGYAPGSGKWQTAGDATSGAVRAEMQNGKRELEINHVARLRDQTERNALKARKPINWQVELTGAKISGPAGSPAKTYYHSLLIEVAKARYSSVELRPAGGSPVNQNIVLKGFDAATVVKATLINTVESYTAALP